MTWWLQTVRAAWARVDAWRARFADKGADEAAWVYELRKIPDVVIPRQGRHRLNTSATKNAADAYVTKYERDRCQCGGSPAWVEPQMQIHRSDCPKVRHARPHDFGEGT